MIWSAVAMFNVVIVNAHVYAAASQEHIKFWLVCDMVTDVETSMVSINDN